MTSDVLIAAEHETALEANKQAITGMLLPDR